MIMACYVEFQIANLLLRVQAGLEFKVISIISHFKGIWAIIYKQKL